MNLPYLRTLGYLAKVKQPINKKLKLEPKVVDYVFLGYNFNMGYIFLIKKSRVHDMNVGIVIGSKDATFFKSELYIKIHLAVLALNLLYMRYMNQ